jgi:hypothetical protein
MIPHHFVDYAHIEILRDRRPTLVCIIRESTLSDNSALNISQYNEFRSREIHNITVDNVPLITEGRGAWAWFLNPRSKMNKQIFCDDLDDLIETGGVRRHGDMWILTPKQLIALSRASMKRLQDAGIR